MSTNGESTGTGQNLRTLREERRKLLRERTPKHYCRHCISVTFAEETVCLNCGAPRPELGWSDLEHANDPWLGRILDGRYLITRPLGEGASAQVYRAESLSISRNFAVKIIATDKGEAQANQIITRLNREIEALSRLRNPHIVSFYEILDLQGSYVAAVMDLINGTTLEDLILEKGPLDTARACALLRQTANGLFEAHQAGMIHRDLKPENLMVERLPAGDDFTYILDFGIVRLTDDTSVSMTHGFIGTPLYASPEQAMAKKIDHRSDIYSLGAILFFMLTGQPPFVSNNVYDVLRMHVRKKPPRLGDVNKNRLFPEALERLVRKMLAKDPSKRPDDLSIVIDSLDKLVQTSLSEAQIQSNATYVGDSTSSPRAVYTPVSGVEAIEPDASKELPKFGRDDHTSAATIQAFSRAKGHVQTPPRQQVPFHPSKPPSNNEPNLAAIPGKISFRGRTASSKDNKALATSIPVPLELSNPDASVLATQSRFGDFAIMEGEAIPEAKLFGAASTSPKILPLATQSKILSLALSDDYLVLGHADGVISRVSIDRSQNQTLFQDVRRKPITTVAIDPKSRCIIAGSESGRVYMHHRERSTSSDWSRIRSGDAVRALAINDAADLAAIARHDNSIEILSLTNTRTPLGHFRINAPVRSMAISADEYLLAATLVDHSLALFQIPTGNRLLSLSASNIRVLSVCFSDEGKPVAICLNGTKVQRLHFEQIGALARSR